MANEMVAGESSNQVGNERIGALRMGDFSDGCRLLWSQDPLAPQPVLLTLAADRNPGIRSGVAANLSTPMALLEMLAGDYEEAVRASVAGNPSTPTTHLTALARDPAEGVRGSVACNPSAPAALLEALANDPVDEVRESVAGNLSTPRPILKQLARDRDEIVREVARETLKGGAPWADAEVALARWIQLLGPGLSANASDALTAQWTAFTGGSARVDPTQQSSAAFLTWLAEGHGGNIGQYLTTQDEVLRAVAAHPDVSVAGLLKLTNYKDRRRSQRRTVAVRAVVALAGRWLLGDWIPTSGEIASLLRSSGDPRALGRLVLSDPAVGPDAICAAAQNGTPPRVILTVAGPDPEFLLKRPSRAKVLAEPDDWPPAVRVRVGAAVDGKDLDKAVGSADRWVRLGVAANPRAEHLADRLSRDPDSEVRALAADRLAATGPARDRAEALAEAQAPPAPGTAGQDWIRALAVERVPEWTERTRVAVASHPAAPGFLLQALAADVSEPVRSAVVSNPSTPVEGRRALGVDTDAVGPTTAPDELAELAFSADERQRTMVAKNPNAPVATLQALARDPAVDVRLAVASNPSTDPDLLRFLADDPDRFVRIRMASATQAPLEVLEVLARDTDDHVRSVVAGNPGSPTEVLGSLADDSSSWVRRGLAGNPALDETLAVRIADDPDESVRGRLAENPALDEALAFRLADDPSEYVRHDLAENPATPIAVIERLRVDDSSYVRKAAELVLRTPDLMLAKDRYTQADDLRRLATHESLDVRAVVAGNPSTPGDVLTALAREERVSVRLAIAGNPSAPEGVLRLLASTEFGAGQVHSAIAGNPATPPDLLAVLSRPPVAGHRYFGGVSLTDNEPCYNLAANPNTPSDVLGELLDHPEGGKVVWPALAVNPGAPPEVVQALAERGVVALLDRPDLTIANLLALAGRKGVTHERATAELLVRFLAEGLTVDAAVMKGLHGSGGDARRLAELIVADPQLPLDVVAAAAVAGVSAKALLSVPAGDGEVLSQPEMVKLVRAHPGEHPEHLRLRAAATSTGAALQAAATSPDPVVRWGSAAAPKAGALLATLVADPDDRVSALVARRVSDALG